MSQTNGQYISTMEIACLPADDPARAELREKLQAAGGSDPVQLEAEFVLTDMLRTALVQVQPPRGEDAIVRRLLDIPDAEPLPAGKPAHLGRFGRMAAAMAIAVGLLGAGTYYLWPRQPSMPVLVRLDPQVENTIVEAAVKNHEAGKPLEIASSDVNAVSKVLAADGMDFPVLMLKTNGTIKLEGGGACEIGKAPAVYTRWAGNGMRYTLYEFNAPDAGAPRDFVANSQLPKNLWHDDKQYRVMVWPGASGKCCWALVLEKTDASNPFLVFDYGAPS